MRETDQDGKAKNWTAEEMENASKYLTWINKNFGAADALVLLIRRYNLNATQLK